MTSSARSALDVGPREDQTLLFVSGLHRSGTTAVARLLGEHPEVSGFSGTGAMEDEGQHLQDVYPAAKRYGGAGRFALHPAAHLTEDSALLTPATAGRLWAAWSPYWDLSRRVLVEKSPPNLVMTRFLQATWPGARFLGVVRHPAVVALSTSKWRARTSLHKLVAHWVAAHEIFRDDMPALQHLQVVKYEQLIARPEPVLEGVREFLGLGSPLSPQSLQTDRSDRYQKQWQELSAGSPRRRRAFDRLREEFEPRVRAFGYSLTDLDAVEDFPAPGLPSPPA